MASAAFRQVLSRSGSLRRDHMRRQQRRASIGAELKAAAGPAVARDEPSSSTAADFAAGFAPARALRFAGRRGGGRRGWPALLVSLALHGGAIAAAMMLFVAPGELPKGGEEAIPVELVVAGSEIESAVSQEGAKTADARIDLPSLPEPPPLDIASELPRVETPPLPEPPSIDVARELPKVDVPPPPDAPPVEVAAELPPPTPVELPPLPDIPRLADLTPPVLATPPAPEPAPEVAPPPHVMPKPHALPKPPATPAPRAARPAPAKPEPRKAEPVKPQPRKIEPRAVAATPALKPEREPRPVSQAQGTTGAGDSDRTRTASTRGAPGAGPTTGASASSVASYRGLVLAHLARFKVYPEAARERGITGRAGVAFTLSRGGQVLSASLSSSSGAPLLDQATLAMVRRAAPFPPMPDGGPSSMSFNAGINYNLR